MCKWHQYSDVGGGLRNFWRICLCKSRDPHVPYKITLYWKLTIEQQAKCLQGACANEVSTPDKRKLRSMIWQGKGSKIPKIWLMSFVHGPSPCFCFIFFARLFTQPHFSVALCHLFELVMLDRDLCLKWGSPCQNFMTIPKSNLVLFHRLGYSNSAFVHTRRLSSVHQTGRKVRKSV